MINAPLHELKKLTVKRRESDDDGGGSRVLTIDLAGDLERAFEKVLEELQKAGAELKAVCGKHGMDEENVAAHWETIQGAIENMVVLLGDLVEQHPDLLNILLFTGAVMLIPEYWVLRPVLGLFGFGPTGSGKGTVASWARRVFYGAAVPEGGWFALSQKAAMAERLRRHIQSLMEAKRTKISNLASQTQDLMRLREAEINELAALQAMISPIAKLPTELLAKIFHLVVPPEGFWDYDMEITNKEIHHLFPLCGLPPGSFEALERFSIESMDIQRPPEGLDIVLAAPRLREVAICIRNDRGSQSDMLGLFRIPWNQLTHLTLEEDLSFEDCRDIMLQCTNARSIKIRASLWDESSLSLTPVVVVLPNMETLEFHQSYGLVEIAIGHLFACLALPALKSLELSVEMEEEPILTWDAGLFSQFQDRSPTIERISLSASGVLVHADNLIALLRHSPAVTEVTIYDCQIDDAFVRGLEVH
ncbi:hypothetical protein B0H14DRAFT_3887158 [Mycena olivaceomarginata]|nr:hypothetical protein B0H14DRAFT_3887158 [Mycena olivaceomarginata]